MDVNILFSSFVFHGTLLDTEEKDWDFSFDLNVKSMYRMCKAFLPKVFLAIIESGIAVRMSEIRPLFLPLE